MRVHSLLNEHLFYFRVLSLCCFFTCLTIATLTFYTWCIVMQVDIWYASTFPMLLHALLSSFHTYILTCYYLTLDIWHRYLTCYTWHLIPDTWYLPPVLDILSLDTWYLTPDIWHLTIDMLLLTWLAFTWY